MFNGLSSHSNQYFSWNVNEQVSLQQSHNRKKPYNHIYYANDTISAIFAKIKLNWRWYLFHVDTQQMSGLVVVSFGYFSTTDYTTNVIADIYVSSGYLNDTHLIWFFVLSGYFSAIEYTADLDMAGYFSSRYTTDICYGWYLFHLNAQQIFAMIDICLVHLDKQQMLIMVCICLFHLVQLFVLDVITY